MSKMHLSGGDSHQRRTHRRYLERNNLPVPVWLQPHPPVINRPALALTVESVVPAPKKKGNVMTVLGMAIALAGPKVVEQAIEDSLDNLTLEQEEALVADPCPDSDEIAAEIAAEENGECQGCENCTCGHFHSETPAPETFVIQANPERGAFEAEMNQLNDELKTEKLPWYKRWFPSRGKK